MNWEISSVTSGYTELLRTSHTQLVHCVGNTVEIGRAWKKIFRTSSRKKLLTHIPDSVIYKGIMHHNTPGTPKHATSDTEVVPVRVTTSFMLNAQIMREDDVVLSESDQDLVQRATTHVFRKVEGVFRQACMGGAEPCHTFLVTAPDGQMYACTVKDDILPGVPLDPRRAGCHCHGVHTCGVNT